MGRIRLVAFDLDGTLLNDDLVIDSRTKEAIRRVREKGITVTLATGRMFSSARPYAVELGLDLPLVVYHGAQVRHSKTGEVLFERTIPLDLASRLIAAIRQFGYAYNVYLDDRLYVEKVAAENEEYARRAGVDLHRVEDMLTFLQEQEKRPLKIVALRDGPELDPLEASIRRQVGGEVYFTRSLPHYLEMLNPEVNKARGLQALAEREAIRPEEIMVFGDSYNDLQMFRYAGWAVAMANAPAEVRAAADYVTGSNNDGGVARALEKFILGG
ncbi:Cof-type HAD-IIB family hydrolase [Moorella sulfitireducens]|uniref:Cof-type HAD-IIB family hydrolase n=1 Tax=Neomoorella sulfitireducens TaxID=2972948 RepID=UPI0021AC416E|nr:Cof-type HAD-IIB family hydrolase [Moorella sulfitireducens]